MTGQVFWSYFSLNYSHSFFVNSFLVFPMYALAISFSIKKSLKQNSYPSENAQILDNTRPYLSNFPASNRTIFPIIISFATSFTYFPNYFTSPFLVSGVSMPLSRKVNLVIFPFSLIATFIVSPSVTCTTFPKNILKFKENYSADYNSSSSLYSSSVNRLSCASFVPSGRKSLSAFSMISFLVSLREKGFFIRFLFFLVVPTSLAEP